jgi:hypothetical protein
MLIPDPKHWLYDVLSLPGEVPELGEATEDLDAPALHGGVQALSHHVLNLYTRTSAYYWFWFWRAKVCFCIFERCLDLLDSKPRELP